MIIDTHQHFWKYDPEEYSWIGPEMKALQRDFLPEDLQKTLRQAGVDGVISVQARQTTGETEWLLSLAEENDFIRGIVGWVPLTDPAVEDLLERYADRRFFKGVRHVLQDEPDPDYMLRKDFNAGIRKLKRYDLLYEILIFERHLPQTLRFVDQHPGQMFVLDHIAKPLIRDRILSPWQENLTELARRDNIFCKISGLVTEADPYHWSEDQLKPYLETVLEAFGPERLMFGSDWPVCLTACRYEQWLDIVQRFIATLSEDEQALIMAENARKVYKL